MLASPVAQLAGYVLLAFINVVIKTPVVDQAAVLPQREREAIDVRLRSLRQQRSVQMAVVTVRSTEGEPIADFSHRAASQWGGGHKERNDGLLLTLAIADRRVRLEVGYGLEGQLPDVIARRILDSADELLRQQKYGPAVFKIIDQIDAQLGGPPTVTTAAPAVKPAPATATAAPAAAAPPAASSAELLPREPAPLPTPPIGGLIMAPLLGLIFGYRLGSWRCDASSNAVDALAVILLVAAAVSCLLYATRDPRGFYLAVSIGGCGFSSMFARTSGLTRVGCVVAVMFSGFVSLVVFVCQLVGDGSVTATPEALQGCLIITVAASVVAQLVAAWCISEFLEKSSLWSQSRAREPKAVYWNGSSSDTSGSWSSGSRSGGDGGGGGGSSGWGGDGGSFGGGGADSSY